jgi:nitrite reductase (NO-forming)
VHGALHRTSADCAASRTTAITSGKTVAASPVSKQSVTRQIVLKTGMAGGKTSYLDEKNNVNPVLRTNAGDTVEITISSGEGAEHDIVLAELNVASKKFRAQTGAVKVSFQVPQSGKFTFYCSIPGHRQIGVEGVLEVTGPADAAGEKPAAKPTAVLGAAPAAAPAALARAAINAVSIAMDPTAVPKPLGARRRDS